MATIECTKLIYSSIKSMSLKEGPHVFYPSCLSPNFPFQILCVVAASGRDRAFPRLAYKPMQAIPA